MASGGLISQCVCCGMSALAHPYIGVGRADLSSNDGPMVEHPVCASCWAHPGRRTKPVKVAFFPRSQAPIAVAMARLMDDKSKAGEDLSLG